MPNTTSAKKALRSSKRKRVFNLRRLRAMRNSIKDTRKVALSGNGEKALTVLANAYKAIDKAVKRGVIKKNSASRKKSHLAGFVNKNIAKSKS